MLLRIGLIQYKSQALSSGDGPPGLIPPLPGEDSTLTLKMTPGKSLGPNGEALICLGIAFKEI